MTFTYDEQGDVLDITLSGALVARTEQIDPGTLIDVDEHGAIVAIELIRPARHWPLDEIAGRLDRDTYQVLRALWGEGDSARFPFASSEQLVPA